MNHTPQGRLLAIVAGLTFTAGALIILMGPVLLTPNDWTSYHVLTVLTVFGTIAAGHLMADAKRSRHGLAVIGFLTLFLAGTSLVVYQSVGRQAEFSDAKVLDTEASNMLIASKGADLAKAKSRFDDANRAADAEMRGERCGPRCKDWRQRATEVGALIAQLEGQIRALGPQKPVEPKAERMADVAALFGADHNKAKAALILLEPFLWTLFFEIGSIVSLGFAFRSSPSISKTFDQRKSEALPDPSMFSGELPEPPKPRKRKTIASNVVPVDFRPKHPVVEALESNGGAVLSNRELAALMQVCEAESSKRVQEIPEMLTVRRNGKRVEIRLKKSA